MMFQMCILTTLVNQQKPKTCTTTFIEKGDILCLVLNIYAG